jgi:hypothetical protein
MIAESEVRAILAHPLAYNGWTVQGLGMLRLELTPDGSVRLHIWDPDAAKNTAASAHNHPWDIERSQIYSGSMGNQYFELDVADGVQMQASLVRCGVGSHLLEKPRLVMVSEAGPREIYGPGEQYSMSAEQFHDSFPTPGTVTVIRRRLRDIDTATICWAGGGAWNQEGFTRMATPMEILHFAALARAQMAR